MEAAFKSGTAWPGAIKAAACSARFARFFKPGYHNHLVQQWLPALDGVVEKLQRGAKVADVGCGHGWSTVLMAKAFPKSTFIGYDYHPSSIKDAQAHARPTGVSGNNAVRGRPGKGLSRKGL